MSNVLGCAGLSSVHANTFSQSTAPVGKPKQKQNKKTAPNETIYMKSVIYSSTSGT